MTVPRRPGSLAQRFGSSAPTTRGCASRDQDQMTSVVTSCPAGSGGDERGFCAPRSECAGRARRNRHLGCRPQAPRRGCPNLALAVRRGAVHTRVGPVTAVERVDFPGVDLGPAVEVVVAAEAEESIRTEETEEPVGSVVAADHVVAI